MSKQLPSVTDLIKDTWKLYTTTWNESVKVSIWFLYFGLASFAMGLLEKFSPQANFLGQLVSVAIAIIALWVGIRLIRTMLRLEAGQKVTFSKEESMESWSLVLPAAWIGFIQTLIILGGTILFIIPGIYLGVALSFSQFLLIDKDLRGMKALAASRALVRGRWWSTFWRVLATGFVFGIGIMVITWTLLAIVAVISGVSPEAFAASELPLMKGTYMLFTDLVQAAVLPLFVGLQVKIYRALVKTQ